MKTLTKRLFTIILSVIVFSFTTNCKQDDLINETEEEQVLQEELDGMSIETQKVNIDEVVGLRQHLNLLGRLAQNRNNGSNTVVTPFGNIPLEDITEVLDTLGNANYTFAIIPSIHRSNKFFNLVVHQEPDQEDFSSSVVEYDLDEAFAQDYFTGSDDFGNFTGAIRVYSAEEFLALTGSEGARACGEDTGLPATDPCVDEDMEDGNNGTAGSDGGYQDESGEGDSDNGDPIGDEGPGDTDGGSNGGGSDSSSRPCTMVLMIINCGANSNNADDWHTNSSCGSTDRSGATYNMQIDCSNPFRTAMRDGIGCPVFGGPAAVSPVPFASLGMAFNLTPEQDLCLSSAANCEHKNEIYDYLNANTITVNNTVVWEQDALDFSGVVLDELFDDCAWDFEVDFDDGVVLDSTFLAVPRLKCVYDKLAGDNSSLFRTTVGAFINDPKFKLIFEVGNCNSTTDACTDDDNVNTTGEIIIRIEDTTTDPINLARYILHEAIHAELIRYVAQYEPGVDPNNKPYLFQLYKHYKGLYENTDIDHIYMTLKFIDPMTSALRQFDNNNYPLEYYKVFAWDGLRRWDADNLLSMEMDALYETYRPIVINNSNVCD